MNDPAKVAPFYLPENAAYTIVDSAVDSVRFTVEKTLTACSCGHTASISTFVDPEGTPMEWHVFGPLEGPGWAGNAVGGACEIHRLGGFLTKPAWQATAIDVVDHVLEHGFVDTGSGFIRGYRHIPTGALCLNYKADSEWFCPGSMAKIAFQLLTFAEVLEPDARADRMRAAATRCAEWVIERVEPVPNGWFPRRCTLTGAVFDTSPEGNPDAFWQTSADGLFVLQLLAALTQRGIADYTQILAEKTQVFMAQGGIFGSINQDTYDADENVARAVAFRVMRVLAQILDDEAIRRFAYDPCLAGLERFKMREDRNGVQTTGLLYMEDKWDTAYLWENAEAALAHFEAALDMRQDDPERSAGYERDGLTILRAIARHHHGPHGFLTEGVDWNNHVGQQHHIGQAEFGAIQYTEPFLNNQHIVEPTLFYLDYLAEKGTDGGAQRWRDYEGNVLYTQRTD